MMLYEPAKFRNKKKFLDILVFVFFFVCLYKKLPSSGQVNLSPIQTGFSGSCAPASGANPVKHSHLYDPTVLLQTWSAPQASGDWHSSKSKKLQEYVSMNLRTALKLKGIKQCSFTRIKNKINMYRRFIKSSCIGLMYGDIEFIDTV